MTGMPFCGRFERFPCKECVGIGTHKVHTITGRVFLICDACRDIFKSKFDEPHSEAEMTRLFEYFMAGNIKEHPDTYLNGEEFLESYTVAPNPPGFY